MKTITITDKMFKDAKKQYAKFPVKPLYYEIKDDFIYSISMSVELPPVNMVNFVIMIEKDKVESGFGPFVRRYTNFPTDICIDDIDNDDFMSHYKKELDKISDKLSEYLKCIQRIDGVEYPFDGIKFE